VKTVSFCFDDGFRASADSISRIFSNRGVAACFCVLAAPELAEDPFIRGARIADWAYWRRAMAAGHEVAPHGYAHEHLGKINVENAQASVQRTLDAFARELPGFDARQSLYHLAYLAAPAPIVEWIGARTLGARMALGNAGRNDPAAWSRGKPIDCLTFGPPDAQSRLRERIARFVRDEDGWLVLVLHGLDGEGWGTLASTALEQMLDELLSANVAVTTPNRLLLSLPSETIR
jgi:peptidoglycan/xylan/chitin deacetylase (PgdA/CDA1 family)